ncbi:MAG: hypothetical protein IJ043_11165 [Clostridia bacterium]|nr:hypothetical protein [Clostridia bacterium]
MFGSRLEVKRFEKDVLRYEARPVVTGRILLYGDSLLTRSSFIYTERHPEKGLPLMEEELRMADGSPAVLNHAFGTSSADDLLYYYDRLVRPYAPRALVISTGGNDFGYGYSPAEVLQILATLIDWFKADFPGAPIYCFKKIPCLKNKGLDNHSNRHRSETNQLLEEYCAEKGGITLLSQREMPFYYADPADIGDLSKTREDIYDADQVHLNAEGYAMFIDHLRKTFREEGLL